MNRRNLLKTAGLALAGSALAPFDAVAKTINEKENYLLNDNTVFPFSSKRNLGTLEVSSIGMGVQNMHRKHNTIVPYRPEMIKILQTAYDHGVTFFDCAEAYGPHENERILGEAIQSFRDKVVITSKFGWNIDLETGGETSRIK